MHRKLKFAAAILAMAMFSGGTAGFYIVTGNTSLDHQIRSFGYEPLKLPSRLWRIGSFYHVLSNGRLSPVCHPAPGVYDGLVTRSDTLTVRAASHFNSDVSIGANLFNTLNGVLGSGALKKVNVTLSSVSAFEIDYVNLHRIAKDMLSDADCHDVATNLVRQGELVCQVAGALQASADYQVIYDNRLDTSVEARETGVGHIEQTLSAEFSGESGSNGWHFQSGSSLFYGVFLNPRCLTLPSDKEPRWRDRSWTARLVRLVS